MLLYSLFISDPSFHFDGSSTRTLQGEGRREVLSEYADEFYSEVKHLQLVTFVKTFYSEVPHLQTSSDNHVHRQCVSYCDQRVY